jgi:hypothetical protein
MRSTVAASSALLWLFVWIFMLASRSIRALLLMPSSLASSCARIRYPSSNVIPPVAGVLLLECG